MGLTVMKQKKVGVEIDKKKLHVYPLLLFFRLLVLIEKEEEIWNYFRFELTAISLFHNGMMRKASKSKLQKL